MGMPFRRAAGALRAGACLECVRDACCIMTPDVAILLEICFQGKCSHRCDPQLLLAIQITADVATVTSPTGYDSEFSPGDFPSANVMLLL